MTGALVAVWLAVAGAAGAACTAKPSEELCQKAVSNIRKLTGQEDTDIGADRRAAVRSCRAQSSRDTVECMADARTAEELYRCGGAMAEQVKKVMEAGKKGSGTGTGEKTGTETETETETGEKGAAGGQ